MSKSVNLDLIPKVAKTNLANAILMLTTYLKLQSLPTTANEGEKN